MTFSPQLEARFDKLLKSYPPGRQRSAMIPMLMYAQDEVGCVTDELIDEVAKRVGVTPLQVNEVLSYYSMLHRKPPQPVRHVFLERASRYAAHRPGRTRACAYGAKDTCRRRCVGSRRRAAPLGCRR